MDALDIFLLICYVCIGYSVLYFVCAAIKSVRNHPKQDDCGVDEGSQSASTDHELTDKQRFVLRERRLMSASLRYDVLHRDGFRCQLCGATQKDGVLLHVDHIVPVSKGGRTEMSNLRTLCDRCNLGKGSKIEKRISE